MQKLKILHFITGLGIGGAENVLLRTLPRLINFEHSVCYFEKKGTDLVEKFRNQGIKVYPIRDRFFSIRAALDFRKVIRLEKPDILVTYLLRADFFGRIFGKLFGVKKIICSILSTLNEKKHIFWLILNTLTSPLVTHFLTNSKSSKILYSKKWHIPMLKITTIYTGIEIKNFDISIDNNKKRKELKIPINDYTIGCVGNLRKEKGQKYLIIALAKVLKNFPNTILLLIGDGNQRKLLEQLIDNLEIRGKVLFLGTRQDIPEILKILDIFVNSSLYEGMSNAIMEAMAAKCAIVASNIPSNRELIENKKSGLLIPAKDSQKLANAIIELLKNPELRKSYREIAFETVKVKFSIQKTIKELDEFFERVYRT